MKEKREGGKKWIRREMHDGGGKAREIEGGGEIREKGERWRWEGEEGDGRRGNGKKRRKRKRRVRRRRERGEKRCSST